MTDKPMTETEVQKAVRAAKDTVESAIEVRASAALATANRSMDEDALHARAARLREQANAAIDRAVLEARIEQQDLTLARVRQSACLCALLMHMAEAISRGGKGETFGIEQGVHLSDCPHGIADDLKAERDRLVKMREGE